MEDNHVDTSQESGSDAVAQLVKQIAAVELANVSGTQDFGKPELQTERLSSNSHSPASSRSKSPVFSTKYRQSMLKTFKQSKAAVLEGRTLWSAIKQRKESEEKVNNMKNRIKKLEADQDKLNRSLVLISSKSQKLLECKREREDRAKEKERAKETEKTVRLERAEKFMKDRIERINKREKSKNKFLNKNRSRADQIKKLVMEGLAERKKTDQETIDKCKARQMKEKLEKSMIGILSSRSKERNRLKDRLEKERENAQHNTRLTKELEEKEQELAMNLQSTLRSSQGLLKYAKGKEHVSPYRLPHQFKGQGEDVDKSEMEKATTGSSRKTTNGRTFDSHKQVMY